MLLWPHMPVWPWFILGCAVLYRWNASAALMFGAYLILFQYFKVVSPNQMTYFLFMTILATGSFLYIEKTVGTILAIVGLIYVAHILGALPNFPKVILSEGILVAGMVASGYIGPSGGILSVRNTDYHRCFDTRVWTASGSLKNT